MTEILINIDRHIAMESHYIKCLILYMVGSVYIHMQFISALQTMSYTSRNNLIATSHKITFSNRYAKMVICLKEPWFFCSFLKSCDSFCHVTTIKISLLNNPIPHIKTDFTSFISFEYVLLLLWVFLKNQR